MYVAYNATATPVSSKEIADKQKLPPRYLEQMMQRLVRAGILRSLRGPKGGYLLARERRRITLGEICEILQKADAEDPDSISVPSTPLGIRIVQPLWDQMSAQTMNQLKQISIADLCEKAEAQQIRKASEEKLDFTI